MSEGMTLVQQLRGRAAYLRDMGRIKSPQLMEQAANELEAHLFQPAQAVDVGAIREVISWLETREGMHVNIGGLADKLTRALSGEKAVEVTADERGMAFVDGLGWVVQCSKAFAYVTDLLRSAIEFSGEKAGRMRKAFVCVHCDGVYADEPVSQCDCLEGSGADFIEAQIHIPSPTPDKGD